MTEIGKLKFDMLKTMHRIVMKDVQDENLQMRWLAIVPDGADDDDFEFIAEDEDLWISACKCFGQISAMENVC